MSTTKPKTATNAPGAKFYAAVAAAIATYLITQQALDLPGWADVVINAAAVGLAAWTAPPQATTVFALPGALLLLGAYVHGGGVVLLVALIAVGFLLAALYVAVVMHQYAGAVILVICAILIFLFV